MLRVLAKIPHKEILFQYFQRNTIPISPRKYYFNISKEILFQYFQRNTIPISPKKYYHSISKEILITRSTSVVAPPWLDAVGSIFINKTLTVFSLVGPAIDCLVLNISKQSIVEKEEDSHGRFLFQGFGNPHTWDAKSESKFWISDFMSIGFVVRHDWLLLDRN